MRQDSLYILKFSSCSTQLRHIEQECLEDLKSLSVHIKKGTVQKNTILILQGHHNLSKIHLLLLFQLDSNSEAVGEHL